MSGQRTNGEQDDAAEEQTGACCSTGHGLSDERVAADVGTLSALGNDTRYEALRHVAAAGEGGACVCELEPALGVSQGAVSQALSRLFSAGLVDRRKEGRWRYYSATQRAQTLLAALDETRVVDDA